VTIQDIGSIGELVAALATVATLAYLALQIRQNTTALIECVERINPVFRNIWAFVSRRRLARPPERQGH
jgi:hypothetical protein